MSRNWLDSNAHRQRNTDGISRLLIRRMSTNMMMNELRRYGDWCVVRTNRVSTYFLLNIGRTLSLSSRLQAETTHRASAYRNGVFCGTYFENVISFLIIVRILSHEMSEWPRCLCDTWPNMLRICTEEYHACDPSALDLRAYNCGSKSRFRGRPPYPAI